eukprot:1177529-Prorocentrum_minimum.AAC.1
MASATQLTVVAPSAVHTQPTTPECKSECKSECDAGCNLECDVGVQVGSNGPSGRAQHSECSTSSVHASDTRTPPGRALCLAAPPAKWSLRPLATAAAPLVTRSPPGWRAGCCSFASPWRDVPGPAEARNLRSDERRRAAVVRPCSSADVWDDTWDDTWAAMWRVSTTRQSPRNRPCHVGGHVGWHTARHWSEGERILTPGGLVCAATQSTRPRAFELAQKPRQAHLLPRLIGALT